MIHISKVSGLSGELERLATINGIAGLMPRLAGPAVIGTRGSHLAGGRVAHTDTGHTSRVQHILPYDCTNIQLRYANWYKNGYGAAVNDCAITVKVGIEYPLGTWFIVTFDGGASLTKTLAANAGGQVLSDPIGLICRRVTGAVTDAAATATSFTTDLVNFATNAYGGQLIRFLTGNLTGQEGFITATGFTVADGTLTIDPGTGTGLVFSEAPALGDTFEIIPVIYSRTFCSVVGTNNVPIGIRSNYAAASNIAPWMGRVSGSDRAHAATDIGGSTQAFYCPIAIVGQPLNGAIPAVCLDGDSIMTGNGDPDLGTGNYRGFGVIALDNQRPYVTTVCPGELITDFQNWPSSGTSGAPGQTAGEPRRFRRAVQATGCKFFVSNRGTNDLATRTLAQMQGSVLEITAAMNAKGMKVFWCTLVPKNTSTDGYATATNQTLPVSGAETTRQGFNSWLRDTSASGYVAQAGGGGLAGVFDTAALVEVNASNVLTPNGGLWKAPGSAIDTGTSSGTNSTTTINDTTKSWTVNAHAGKYVYLTGGTGVTAAAGYIVSNTATQLTVLTAWAGATPDATSTYAIVDSYTIDGTHPTTRGHTAMAAGIDKAQLRV